MMWLKTIGKGIGHGLGWLGRLWQRLLCAMFNLRRRLIRRRRPDYLLFTLESALTERTPQQPWFYSFLPFATSPTSLESLSAALRVMAGDPDLRGVLFLVKGASVSLAQAQSVADLFRRFRRWDHEINGTQPDFLAKEIIVYLESTTNSLYALATAADRIITPPQSDWNVIGLHSEPTFLADTLALAGIRFDVVKIAPWKTAFDRFSQSAISEANAAQVNWLLDGIYDELVGMIAHGRGLAPEAVRTLINRAPLTAEAAQEAGLIDAIGYEDQLPGLLTVHEKGEAREARLLSAARAHRHLLRRPRRRSSGLVGVISLTGSIMPGKSRTFPVELPILGDKTIGSSTVQQQIRAALNNVGLSAVVLHIDSGGGSAAASDLMWREISLLARKVPLVVYMGDVAASGGYYIATPARHIVAQPASYTGSIGVISGKPLTTGSYDKLQAHRYSLRRGEHADLYSDQTPWEGEARRVVEASVEENYRAFKMRVADGRNIPYDELDPICSGKVWTGKQALAHGLIDSVGDFGVAVETACRLAELPNDGSVRVVNLEAGGSELPISAQKLGLNEDRRVWVETIMAVVRRDREALLGNERIWFWADGLPRIR